MNRSKIIKSNYFYLILVILSTLITVGYLTILNNQTYLSDVTLGVLITFVSKKLLLLFFVVYLVLYRILLNDDYRAKVTYYLYTYRYPILIAILIVCVIFQIHGSSINEIDIYHTTRHNPLLGISRNLRSDEYVVNTMFSFSQYPNGFGYFSEIIRASVTDVFLLYGQPVLDIAVLFHPFQIGYLFLDPARGLSFYWIARLLALFIVSFEFGMFLTKNNKKLALAYSLLITLSPFVQWWFSTNGLVEQLVFGQLGVLLIDKYITHKSIIKRALISFTMIIALGAFIMAMYPAWQIPFGYVFLILGFYVIITRFKEITFTRKDIGILLVALAIFTLIMVHILNNSFDTILALMNTAYPGGEVFNGGGPIGCFFNYVDTLFYPFYFDNMAHLICYGNITNIVEGSSFFDFFPIPIILSLFVILYQKNRDKLLIILMALFAIFTVVYLFALPEFLIKITLMNKVKPMRLFRIISFLGVLILIRAMSLLKPIKNKKLVIISSLILSCLIVFTFKILSTDVLLWTLGLLVVILTITFSFIFLSGDDKAKRGFLICCIVICLASSALVNPIDYGADTVFETPLAHEVTKIVSTDPNATWITTGDMKIDTLLPLGAHTLNSVHVYPDLDKWHSLDENHQYESVYNRYAHIIIFLQDDSDTSFELSTLDSFIINLNINDLETLNVTYIATTENFDNLGNNNIHFEKIYQDEHYKIYKLHYNH